MANASDSIFLQRASDVCISQKTEISVLGKYLYVSIVNNQKIAYPLEEVPFLYPFNDSLIFED
jgi:hypothetical protein